MTGLEERGYRPIPATAGRIGDRGAVAAWAWMERDRRWRLLVPYLWHELQWGVPCGPTLTMLPLAQWHTAQVIERRFP